MTSRITSAFLVLGLASLVACGNDDGTDGGNNNGCTPLEPRFSVIHAEIFNTGTCNAGGACHGPGPQGDLLFDTDVQTSFMNSTGATFQAESRATFPNRVVAGDPANSFLYLKVSDPNVEKGIMPLGGTPLDSCKQDAIRQWIEQGAQNN